ncbi:MAG: 5-(carboxyamino)imidazole ribonucleotide synthase [Rubrivivax sp.]|nr:5-(carboxyamino)imidazole ribonucleotide synthase [Rubrivivax sp.]
MTAHAATRPAALGMLGGGQLGRMFVHAAQRLGHRVWVLDPDPASPAAAAADEHLCAAYDDAAALELLAAQCDAVSTEFENVPAAALRRLAELGCRVAPSAEAVATCQHRAREKALFERAGVPCAPWLLIERDADLQDTRIDALLPGILKTATLGYDGKGQVTVATRDELRTAFASALKGAPCVLEKRMRLAAELSVIVARGSRGETAHLPLQANVHRAGILAVTEAPAPGVPAATAEAAFAHAALLAESLGYVGVLCVEFFVLEDGRLLANEMAPRPHNSGHYSIDACDLSQFDFQVRTLLGLPLPAPRQHSAAVMLNLLGDLWFAPAGDAAREPDWPAVLALPGAHLHLYGKREARRGRKMGHLTVTAASRDEARRVAGLAAAALGLPPLHDEETLATPRIAAAARAAPTGADGAAVAQAVDDAAAALARGELVAMPTETVYGLAARADDDGAVARVFAAKGRPTGHPLIVHVADAAAAQTFAAELPASAHRLMAAFWPGPLTIIVPRRSGVAAAAAAGLPTVGLRMPSHPLALALLRAAAARGVPGVAAPSANRFGHVSPTTAAHVRAEFGPALRVLDGGPCPVGIESAIVDCTREPQALLRPGQLGRERIEAALGVRLAERDAASPRASGTLEAHYAPKAALRLLDSAALAARVAAAPGPADAGVGVYSRVAPGAGWLHRPMPGDADAAAHELFAALRWFDEAGATAIWVEQVPSGSAWEGVRDRLARAAAAAAGQG